MAVMAARIERLCSNALQIKRRETDFEKHRLMTHCRVIARKDGICEADLRRSVNRGSNASLFCLSRRVAPAQLSKRILAWAWSPDSAQLYLVHIFRNNQYSYVKATISD
jgi:hypothetical protein